MWVLAQVFEHLTLYFPQDPKFMQCFFTVYRIFQKHNTHGKQFLAVITLDALNFSTNFPFGHEGPAENVLSLQSPSSKQKL